MVGFDEESRQVRINSRVALRERGCVDGRPVQSPVGVVVAVNEVSMVCIRFSDGRTQWYRAEELRILPDPAP